MKLGFKGDTNIDRKNNKTLLITGASRGIGLQLALRYAAPDVNLILVARNGEKLAEVADVCRKLGAHVVCETIDVRDAMRLKAFILGIDETFPIDMVIANAGIASTLQSDWQEEIATNIEQVFATNIQGTINTITPLINQMILRKKGQIVMMSSLASFRGLPQSPSYCASKAALRIYGQSLRGWLQRYNVKVNVICPGYIKTEMTDNLVGPKPFLISSEKAAKIIQRGLNKNKACITFPRMLSMLIKLADMLPERPVDAILNRFESYVK